MDGEEYECTVGSLLDYYQLKEGTCNQQVTDKHLCEIASSYCRQWRTLRAKLGLKNIVEHDIDYSIPGDEEGRRHAFFDKWKLVKGSAATYKILISALLEIKCRDDAEGVCRLLKKSLRRKDSSKASTIVVATDQSLKISEQSPTELRSQRAGKEACWNI
jgi:hypothetical protein